jgi:hypothetical protein
MGHPLPCSLRPSGLDLLLPEKDRPATSITMLLRAADQAMYAAKGTDNLLTVRECTM